MRALTDSISRPITDKSATLPFSPLSSKRSKKKYRHNHRNDTFKVLLDHNDHCSAVEVLYYITHY